MVVFLHQQLIEPGIPKFTRRHLNGYLVAFGIILGLKASAVKRNRMFPAIIPDKRFVPLRFLAPETKVPVSHPYPVSTYAEKVEHHHGVESPAYGEEDSIVAAHEVMLPDVFLEPFPHEVKSTKRKAVCVCFLTLHHP
jgi:hypothetical protein